MVEVQSVQAWRGVGRLRPTRGVGSVELVPDVPGTHLKGPILQLNTQDELSYSGSLSPLASAT